MVIYEVNVSVEEGIKDSFNEWLDKHISKMLSFQGFLGFTKSFNVNEKKMIISYFLTSKDDLDKYLLNDAKKMRDDGIKKFGTKFSTSRRILHIVDYKLDFIKDKPA